MDNKALAEYLEAWFQDNLKLPTQARINALEKKLDELSASPSPAWLSTKRFHDEG
jgi:hypothetical protein